MVHCIFMTDEQMCVVFCACLYVRILHMAKLSQCKFYALAR